MVYRLASATVTPLQLQRENERIATSRRKITKSGKSQQSWVHPDPEIVYTRVQRGIDEDGHGVGHHPNGSVLVDL